MQTNQLTRRCVGIMLAVTLSLVPLIGISDTIFPTTAKTLDGTNNPPTDLIDDRPTAIGSLFSHSVQAVEWVWGTLRDNVFSWITPPTPTSLTHSVSKQDAVQLFKLLGDTGYKLKEIHTDVGIIPSLSFKFSQSRELSDADYEYLETQLDEWEHKSPGMYASLQRKIISTIMTVNLGGEYQVSTLNVSLLPLPDVAFTMSANPRALGDEGRILMRAIQQIDRDVQTIGQGQKN